MGPLYNPIGGFMIKLEDHYYLIRQTDEGIYFIAKPVYNLEQTLDGWVDQFGSFHYIL